jgi:NAD(P)-dependent dehydrogenase (short-subunit alcohol dehydrogenase family)
MTTYQRFDEDAAGCRQGVYVCGARQGSNNIGEAVVEAFAARGWDAIGDDCAVGDGSRPPGGNLPDDETAEKFGYTVTDKGRYQRFTAPSVDSFFMTAPNALVVTLGKTYKGHFAEIWEWDIANVIKANLILPLECVWRFVHATQTIDNDRQVRARLTGNVESYQEIRNIVLVGSYAHDHPFTNGTLYCAAKAGLDMAARTLGWELTDRGYRVHVVHPYHVNGTPMWAQVEQDVMRTKNMTWEEADAYNRKDLKMPDLLTPEEVAEVITTLVTVPAMGWMSGQPVNLYGGSR